MALFAACSNSKYTGAKSNKSERYIAWNEDTIVTCQFAVRTDYKFAYLISTLDSSGKLTQKIYNGIVKFQDEKIHLFYDRNIKPANVQSYLIKKITGDYLIQDFTDGRKRMYLRIAYPSRYHR